ncbi:MAG: hypothetical protein OIF49_14260 [Thiotrichaceae bacterium]|nr:hypothetical protein [Thiotrichaceae bacterium]
MLDNSNPNAVESFDVGILHVTDTSLFEDTYDEVANTLLVNEYFPISGDLLSTRNSVESKKQFEIYDATGNISWILSYVQPLVDKETGAVNDARIQFDDRFIDSTNSTRLPSLYPDTTTYIFRNPTEENEFFSCTTNIQGYFISSSEQSFSIEGAQPLSAIPNPNDGKTCQKVTYISPVLGGASQYEYQNLCSCIWGEHFNLSSSASGQYEILSSNIELKYDVGLLRDVHQIQYFSYDDVEFSPFGYTWSPISGDYLSADASVESKQQFERYDATGKLVEVATFISGIVYEFGMPRPVDQIQLQEYDQGGNITADNTSILDSVALEPNATYIFKNPAKANEFFSCDTNSDGYFISANEPFTIAVENENDDSGSENDDNENDDSGSENDDSENDGSGSENDDSENDDSSSSDTETKKPIKIPPPQPNYYLLSVTSSQAHIRSTPSGIDCEYGSGSCKKSFPRGTTVKLEAIEINKAESSNQNDYSIEWVGNDHGCKTQTINMTDHINCMVKVYGKQKTENADNSNMATHTNAQSNANTVTNQLQLVNFSGHSILPGGSKNVMLGFVLEGEGTASLTLHADILEQGVLPELQLSEVLTNHQGIYGKLLQRQQQSNNFSFEQAADAGTYTLSMNSVAGSGRGMAGVSVANTKLDMTNISVRGYLKNALVMNFIVSGQGTQKAKLNTRILSGQVSTELHLINLSTQQGVTGQVAADGTEIELNEGIYAAILHVLEGEGVGMIEVNLTP